MVENDVLQILINVHTFMSMVNHNRHIHYGDVIMGAIASQITSITILYSTAYSDAGQRKHQSSASLAFVWGNSPGTGEFPAQLASNAENVSIWWRHHVYSMKQHCWNNTLSCYVDLGRIPGVHSQSQVAVGINSKIIGVCQSRCDFEKQVLPVTWCILVMIGGLKYTSQQIALISESSLLNYNLDKLEKMYLRKFQFYVLKQQKGL